MNFNNYKILFTLIIVGVFILIYNNKVGTSTKYSSSETSNNKINKELKNEGRLLVRKSGTENIIRIMVESLDQKLIEDTLSKVKKIIVN